MRLCDLGGGGGDGSGEGGAMGQGRGFPRPARTQMAARGGGPLAGLLIYNGNQGGRRTQTTGEK